MSNEKKNDVKSKSVTRIKSICTSTELNNSVNLSI